MTTNRKTEFPDFDNGILFDAIAERLAPFGFSDSSWANDVCPSIGRFIDRDESRFIHIFVDYRHGSEFDPESELPRISMICADWPGKEDCGYFHDTESVVRAALELVRESGIDAHQMPLNFGGLGISFDRATEFVRDMFAAGLAWHWDDSPAGIGNRATPESDWVDVFSPEQCASLDPVRVALHSLNWGRFECVHGYSLAVLQQMESETELTLPGFYRWQSGGNLFVLRKDSGRFDWLVSDADGTGIPTHGESALLCVYDSESGDEIQCFNFGPGELSGPVFSRIEREFLEKESSK